jgi:hypothetical protein
METALVFIVLFGGLFTAISLNIYFKFKTQTFMSERVPLESLSEWYKSNIQAKNLRSRGTSLRWGGLIAGIGFGSVVSLLIWIANLDWMRNDRGTGYEDEYMIFSLMACIAFTILCGGAGMIGAWFLERRLDRK